MTNLQFEHRLSNVSVLGAAGKMGRGIVLCVLQYLANRSISGNPVAGRPTILAIDTSTEGLQHMLSYLRINMQKFAERNIITLRSKYQDNEQLIENSEHVEYFITEMLSVVSISTNIQASAEAELIFEAIPEKPELKKEVLLAVRNNSTSNPWILSNTSSIPINELARLSGLEGSTIGFHFYNPPSVQKLVEIIPAETTDKELADFANWLADELRKTKVYSRDIAGFIGNGVFIREIDHALRKVDELRDEMPFEQAVMLIDKVTRDCLVRPMGIFQLSDYVGLDICLSIAGIMQAHLSETYNFSLFSSLLDKKIPGGQFANGSQKDGLFQYVNNKAFGVYSPELGSYVSIAEIEAKMKSQPGEYVDYPAWKAIVRDKDVDSILKRHFEELFAINNLKSNITMAYLKFYREAGNKLLELKVVDQQEQINQVMKLGFHQLYGPFNSYTKMQ